MATPYYTVEMFDIDNVENLFPDLKIRKEVVEFQIKQFQQEFDKFKEINYLDMLVYERKKMHNPNIIPDKTVLAQIKANENDPAVKEFRQTLNSLNRELNNINTTFENAAKKIEGRFSFTEKNLERYLDNLSAYYDGKLSMDLLMEDICNYEFNDKKLWYYLKWQRNIPVMELLVFNAPEDWKHLFMNIIEEIGYQFKLYEIKYREEYMVPDRLRFLHHLDVELAKLEGEL